MNDKDIPETGIYIVNSDMYDTGYHRGGWVDINQSQEEIETDIGDILQETFIYCPRNWAIKMYVGLGGINWEDILNISNIGMLSRLAKLKKDYGEIVFNILVDTKCITKTEEILKNCDIKIYNDNLSYTRKFAKNNYSDVLLNHNEVNHLLEYIDYEKLWKDIVSKETKCFYLGYAKFYVFSLSEYNEILNKTKKELLTEEKNNGR